MTTSKILSKLEAETIAKITSDIFLQGSTWVLRTHDLESGAQRLKRGLTKESALKLLDKWRKKRVEELLRENPDTLAYTLRYCYYNPHFPVEPVWLWADSFWYTSEEEAKQALQLIPEDHQQKYEIYQTMIKDLPGHFTLGG